MQLLALDLNSAVITSVPLTAIFISLLQISTCRHLPLRYAQLSCYQGGSWLVTKLGEHHVVQVVRRCLHTSGFEGDPSASAINLENSWLNLSRLSCVNHAILYVHSVILNQLATLAMPWLASIFHLHSVSHCPSAQEKATASSCSRTRTPSSSPSPGRTHAPYSPCRLFSWPGIPSLGIRWWQSWRRLGGCGSGGRRRGGCPLLTAW
ncbi:hypothetical protein FGO68_gene15941 [Halteria grandinella]|uniref:Uncharacterized protein n=1 Tax=Halteria grandinella TaxID=5974 RepID=A0A8J8NC85_HALGN|nr:hypothetical protein FGO68_gene15941 [Halteria grandinella]